jgi:hypothetical protein
MGKSWRDCESEFHFRVVCAHAAYSSRVSKVEQNKVYFIKFNVLLTCIIVTWLRVKHNQLDTHFTFTYTLLRFKVLTFFGHYLPIIKRQYTNAALVTIVCSCRCGLIWYQPTSTIAHESPKLHSCSVSWWWASNARNMSRHWTSIQCEWKWSVYQVGCVYYVITLCNAHAWSLFLPMFGCPYFNTTMKTNHVLLISRKTCSHRVLCWFSNKDLE